MGPRRPYIDMCTAPLLASLHQLLPSAVVLPSASLCVVLKLTPRQMVEISAWHRLLEKCSGKKKKFHSRPEDRHADLPLNFHPGHVPHKAHPAVVGGSN
jgi:hypothetical protein